MPDAKDLNPDFAARTFNLFKVSFPVDGSDKRRRKICYRPWISCGRSWTSTSSRKLVRPGAKRDAIWTSSQQIIESPASIKTIRPASTSTGALYPTLTNHVGQLVFDAIDYSANTSFRTVRHQMQAPLQVWLSSVSSPSYSQSYG